MVTDGSLVLDALWRPRLMQLDDNFFVAAFPFMKILTAWGLIRAAEQDGFLSPDTLVVESSSGNLGIGLAIVCAQRGQPLMIIADTNLGLLLFSWAVWQCRAQAAAGEHRHGDEGFGCVESVGAFGQCS